MLDKLFGWNRKKTEQSPLLPFGRYSDNNKPVAKVNRWTDAENHFKAGRYGLAFDAFFDYLADDRVQNVRYERQGDAGSFSLYQGSKIVRGRFDQDQLLAEVTLARMPQASVPVMRRLLEMNFSLRYTRFALDEDRLCMRFDSTLASAGPSKLYHGLKELSTKADKQDDLLVQDFAALQSSDSDHVQVIADAEKAVKYDFLQKWIADTLEQAASLDADKFAGGISYMLLSLIYRIDYLITPEGNLLNELEKIAGIYFRKDDRQPTEKNRDMQEELRKLQSRSREDIYQYLFRSRYTFSIVAPQTHKAIADSIHAANQSMIWYRDNGYPHVANQIIEYGISYCQYSYSLPRVITDLFHFYMEINYAPYFGALGYKKQYYDAATNRFDSDAILDRIRNIQEQWKEKFPLMDFKTQNLRFDSLVNFNQTFTTELEFLNMENK